MAQEKTKENLDSKSQGYRSMLIISLPMEGYRTITGQGQASLQRTLSGCCQARPTRHRCNILSKSLGLSKLMQDAADNLPIGDVAQEKTHENMDAKSQGYRGMLIISLPMEGYRSITGQVQASLQHTLSGCCQARLTGHMLEGGLDP